MLYRRAPGDDEASEDCDMQEPFVSGGTVGGNATSGKRKVLAAVAGMLIAGLLTICVISVAYFPVTFLKSDEQLLLTSLTGRSIQNGPGVVLYNPLTTKGKRRSGILLSESDYVVVTDELNGMRMVHSGPKLVFPNAYDRMGRKNTKLILKDTQYAILHNETTGHRHVVLGPAVVVPGPTESIQGGKPVEKTVLRKNQFVKVHESTTGEIRVVRGPAVVVPQPTENVVGGIQEAVNLRADQYVRLTDSATGVVKMERGEKLVFPGPLETFGEVRSGYRLEKNQYIRLVDKSSGEVRLEVGEQLVFPTAQEDLTAEVKDAINVDDETAVVVLSKETGQQRLVTDPGLFFPGSHEEISDVRELIRVQPHEVAIVQDNSGVYHFHDGSSAGQGQGTAFFLQPYHELVTMYWSSGTSPDDLANNKVANAKKVAYKVPVTKIDMRAQYAFFEYNVRTSDNVELVLEGTIFWQVEDVPKMIQRTGDPKGDVWYHARSSLIQAVSKTTLEEFMAGFNDIVANAAAMDSSFYDERGVKVHNLEVVRYECADKETAGVLQQIIQETTHRINRMQQQESKNEVERASMAGKIAVEKQRTELVEATSANDRALAAVQGEAQGLRLAHSAEAFMKHMADAIPDSQARLDLYRFFAEQATSEKQTENLAGGRANLFLTPSDLNLRLQMGAVSDD